MKTAIGIGSAYYNGDDWDQLVEYTKAADKMGVTQAWSAEAWGMDAIVPLAYLAGQTENIQLGTGILQISSRVPSMIAMTAQSLDTVSNGRFCAPSYWLVYEYEKLRLVYWFISVLVQSIDQ